MCWILELHYLGKSIDNTVSTRDSTSCSGWNTKNSDTIHSLYFQNDLHLLLAFPLLRAGTGGGGCPSTTCPVCKLPGVFIPSSGQKCCIMEAGGQRRSHHLTKSVCVYVCVCVCFRSPEFTSTWNFPVSRETGKWGMERWRSTPRCTGVWLN